MRKYLVLVCFYSSFFAQSPVVLDSVIVTDVQSRWLSASEAPLVLNRQEIRRDNVSLARLFEFSFPVQIRHNGSGGVASVSFRGTSPQQTAVLWNGVPVNSAFNGQGDFAGIPVYGFDQIRIQSGGGSVLYGSSAIGGSVHLDNKLRFSERLRNELHLSGGSFGYVGGQYEVRGGSDKLAFQGTLSHQQGDNDFQVRDFTNRNAEFRSQGMNIALGYRINERHFLSFYNQAFAGRRQFPIWLATDNQSGFHDSNQRNMLQWSFYADRSRTRVKAAYLAESYRYFPTRDRTQFDFGKSGNTWLQLWHEHTLSEKWDLDLTAEYQNTDGSGSDIDARAQQNGALAAMTRYKFWPHWSVQAGLRQEISTMYKSPLLYSGRLAFESMHYAAGISVSKNFRMPSFNERYWRLGGNPDLLPESALQVELSQRFTYKGFVAGATVFHNSISDMIQWIPVSGIHWRVVNAQQVEIYGASAELSYNAQGERGPLKASLQYAYTRAKSKPSDKQLIYVPEHQLTSQLEYRFRRLNLRAENAVKGRVHTRSDNDLRAALPGYWLANAAAEFSVADHVLLRATCRNAFDVYYFSMENRPMPGRHYEFSIHYTFL